MGINIVDKINTLKHDELKKIKTELEPHFKKGVTFEILGDKLKVCDEGICYTILKIKTNGEIDNDFDSYYRSEGMRINDIFEEVGTRLTEIKVKPIKPANEFYLELWKEQFAERHGLSIIDRSIYLDNEMVMSKSGHVGFGRWNNYLFVNNHHIFKFNPFDNSRIKNQELANEFERVFVIMKDYLDKIEKEKPDLNKEQIMSYKEFQVKFMGDMLSKFPHNYLVKEDFKYIQESKYSGSRKEFFKIFRGFYTQDVYIPRLAIFDTQNEQYVINLYNHFGVDLKLLKQGISELHSKKGDNNDK